MSRRYRLVVENFPHHVIQRGNRRQKVFFSEQDKEMYLVLLKEQCRKFNVLIWAYCLMDNHVHLVLVPGRVEGLAKAVAQTHWRYTFLINKREGWRGYLWQGRFSSFVLHEIYLRAVVRYVELNPVRAGIVARAGQYSWSSAKAHIAGGRDKFLDHLPLLDEIKDWAVYLKGAQDEKEVRLFRRHLSTGRPLGDQGFLKALSLKFGIDLLPQKPGRKPGNKCVSP